MLRFCKKIIPALLLSFIIGFSGSVSALTPAELAKKYQDPNMSAQEAADYYCQDPAHTPGSGSSVILPVGGVKIESDGWVYVTLRSMGCGSAGERSVTFYGFNKINGQMVIDLSPSDAVNVTGQVITGAGGGALIGDDFWMADRGVNEADGSSGYDLKIRLKGSVFQESKLYEQAIKGSGLGWFVSPTCPTPLAFANIDQNANAGSCVLTGGKKSNVANINYAVTVDVYPPNGKIDIEDIDGSSGAAMSSDDACSKVAGWVKDEDNLNTKLTVNVFVAVNPGGVAEGGAPILKKVYTTVANGARADDGNGYGFVVPQEVLNAEIKANIDGNNPNVRFYFKAIGILQNGDPVGGEDGLDFGDVEVKACPKPVENNNNNNGGGGVLTPKTGALLGAGIVLTAGAVAGGYVLYAQRKHKNSLEAKKAEK